MATITAVGIKNIWYADPAKVTGDLTGTLLGTILKDPTTKKVPNVHQDTRRLDDAEPFTKISSPTAYIVSQKRWVKSP